MIYFFQNPCFRFAYSNSFFRAALNENPNCREIIVNYDTDYNYAQILNIYTNEIMPIVDAEQRILTKLNTLLYLLKEKKI